jgi:checkpoint serine/threonine-protein kinase
MTFHTRAATDEIYNIFNQPLKSETATPDHGDSLFDSDYEDDDYTSAGESTGTGRVSAETSEFGDDETSSLRRPVEDDEDEDVESLGEWTEFSTSKHVPKISSVGEPTDGLENIEPGEVSVSRAHEKDKFIPEMPEDYDAPTGPYRDAAVMAQNRLPFMTPIIEKTESSLPSYTAARSRLYDTKTPCKTVEEIDYTSPGSPAEDLLLASPGPNTQVIPSIQSPSPAIKSLRRTPVKQTLPVKIVETDSIIKDEQCDPTDKAIRNKILRTIQPPLTAYPGYHDHSTLFGSHAADIQKYSKTLKKSSKSGDKASFTPPVLSLPGAQRSYAIRRELGVGAYGPVYLAESLVNVDTHPSASEGELEKDSKAHSLSSSQRPDHDAIRYGLEAIKMETDSPSGWEFYMIQTAHARLKDSPSLCRAADSIVQAHEVHIFKDESFLVEGYHGQGTLLDLVNIIRTEAITSTGNSEAGMDEALAMFFSIELFRTIEALHSCGILHGDIKPDNCLVRFPEKPRSALPPSPSESLIDLADDDITADPSEIHYSPRGLCSWRLKGLTLIDFGRGIDLKAFRQDVQFIAEWDISQHECNEVREMRPWSYHIDLYGVAVTIHAMLFGKYLESVPVCGDESRHSGSCHSFTTGPGLGPDGGGGNSKRYRIRESFKRYWEREIWTDVFDLLLNPGSDRWVQMEKSSGNPASLPVLHSMRHVREKMEAWLVANAEKRALSLQIRKLEAHLSRRKERLDKER